MAFCPWSLQPRSVFALGGVLLPLPLEEAGVLAFPFSPAPSPLSLPSSQPLQSLTFTSMRPGIQVGPGLSAWGGGWHQVPQSSTPTLLPVYAFPSPPLLLCVPPPDLKEERRWRFQGEWEQG